MRVTRELLLVTRQNNIHYESIQVHQLELIQFVVMRALDASSHHPECFPSQDASASTYQLFSIEMLDHPLSPPPLPLSLYNLCFVYVSHG